MTDGIFDDIVIDQSRPFSSELFNIYFLFLPGSFHAWHARTSDSELVDQLIENYFLLIPGLTLYLFLLETVIYSWSILFSYTFVFESGRIIHVELQAPVVRKPIKITRG